MRYARSICAGLASVILFDPIFQGLAISLMAGEIASLLTSRKAVPVLYFMVYKQSKGGGSSEARSEGGKADTQLINREPDLARSHLIGSTNSPRATP
jgi:hypothetical protein